MRNIENMMVKLTVALFVITFTATSGWAQAISTAQISGTVKDQSGAILPGVEVTAIQTETGLRRSIPTGETGSYILTSLPVGPYRLEASLPGFRTYVQTGIVLQVNSNPVVNAVLEVGQIAETIEVQADAALVETRSTGVGTVIDNQRIQELPLNGRQVTQLIVLAGMSTPASSATASLNSVRRIPTLVISVAGGTGEGLNYLLDGTNYNEAYDNQALQLPFPDALQEFRVETGASPAQYGYHSNATVNAVTKSGTNAFHGDLFEFVRNGAFNARNFFAARRDTLKRNQFGGVLGGPIQKNKLFFFAAYQATVERSDPPTSLAFIPTPAMLAGDFTTIASPACNSGRQITLAASQGFTGNRISPSRFDPVALKITSLLPTPTDPCGQVRFPLKSNYSEHDWIGRVDYQKSDNNSMFARLTVTKRFKPTTYDGKNALTLFANAGNYRIYSLTVGNTYVIGSGMVSSFRANTNRSWTEKLPDDFNSWSDLGSRNFTPMSGKTIQMTVAGNGFAVGSVDAVKNLMHSGPHVNLVEDLSFFKGSHQIGFGVNYLHTLINWHGGREARGTATFNGSVTGLSLADFMIGNAATWSQGNISVWYLRQHYVGLYLQDSWKVNSRFTLNYGVRWEPYMPPRSKEKAFTHFDKNLFAQGTHSSVFVNAPAGVIFPGDSQYTVGNAPANSSYNMFVPRIGLTWDPQGDGRTSIRAAYGMFTDRKHLWSYTGFTVGPPFGNLVSLTNVSISNPYGNYPGGNPFPFTPGKNMQFPLYGAYSSQPWDFKPTYMNQWTLSVQRQFGTDWLVTANYLGNNTIHLSGGTELNPAVFLGLGPCAINGVNYSTCSTTGNTNQRRLFNLQNQRDGQYYSTVSEMDNGGTASYQGLLLSVQKRLSHGINILANHTWSHCISDYWTPTLTGGGQVISFDRPRSAYRSNCRTGDTRHAFNLSTVIQTPSLVGAPSAVRAIAGNWQFSPIIQARSAQFFTVTTGADNALSGTGSQVPNLVGNPYPANQDINLWIDRAAFQSPATGTYGNLGQHSLKGPGTFQFDMAMSREFAIREGKTIQVRGEAFNLLNHANFDVPVSALNSQTFGRIQNAGDPRILQFALKLIF
jgi:hypothetical protein